MKKGDKINGTYPPSEKYTVVGVSKSGYIVATKTPDDDPQQDEYRVRVIHKKVLSGEKSQYFYRKFERAGFQQKLGHHVSAPAFSPEEMKELAEKAMKIAQTYKGRR